MICGIFEKARGCEPQEAHLRSMFQGRQPAQKIDLACKGPVMLASLEPELQPGVETSPGVVNRGQERLSIAWWGEIYNRVELAHALGLRERTAAEISDRALFRHLYETEGLSGVEKINGYFAFAVYDRQRQDVVLGRDRLGLATLYYYEDPQRFVFGSKLALILAHPAVSKALNPDAFRRFLVFNYNPAWDTFFQQVRKVRPGHLAVLGSNGVREQCYWFLSFAQPQNKPVAEHGDNLRHLMQDAIRLRLQNAGSMGVFLSGGMDSSSVAGLMRDLVDQPFSTFSYRCLGKSFDESAYARIMATYCGSAHHEVVYHPSDVRHIESMVKLMDEPFCDVGINIATFLLGQTAQGKVSHVFSGDGGDELFGGHPVYSADRMASLFERLPYAVRAPIAACLKRLPDSDQKKNLTVKLKRFSESLDYPRELGTHRWRIYYGDDDLDQLLPPDWGINQKHAGTLFTDVLDLMREADGPDTLSRSLYGDFQTVLGFSLRRMDLLRSFQIRPHFPLLDHRLVEYAASIPSPLKIRWLSDTKYIQKRAMQGVLPDEIVYRKDKLGHSIPFKNWLRNDPVVKQFVQDVLTRQTLKERGVNYQYVQTLWDQHQSGRQNNSHRLWSLTVLELWMDANNL